MGKLKQVEYQRRYREVNRERMAEATRKWREANPEKMAESNRKWNEANPEKVAEYQRRYRLTHPECDRQYYATHKEEILQRQKQHRIDHPEEEKQKVRKHYHAHAEEVRQRVNQYYQTPEGRATMQRANSARRSRLKEVINTLTAEEWQAILEAHDFRCAYCGRSLLDLFTPPTRDHVIPISKGGDNTKENVVPACKSCNSRKGDGKFLPTP